MIQGCPPLFRKAHIYPAFVGVGRLYTRLKALPVLFAKKTNPTGLLAANKEVTGDALELTVIASTLAKILLLLEV